MNVIVWTWHFVWLRECHQTQADINWEDINWGGGAQHLFFSIMILPPMEESGTAGCKPGRLKRASRVCRPNNHLHVSVTLSERGRERVMSHCLFSPTAGHTLQDWVKTRQPSGNSDFLCPWVLCASSWCKLETQFFAEDLKSGHTATTLNFLPGVPTRS